MERATSESWCTNAVDYWHKRGFFEITREGRDVSTHLATRDVGGMPPLIHSGIMFGSSRAAEQFYAPAAWLVSGATTKRPRRVLRGLYALVEAVVVPFGVLLVLDRLPPDAVSAVQLSGAWTTVLAKIEHLDRGAYTRLVSEGFSGLYCPDNQTALGWLPVGGRG